MTDNSLHVFSTSEIMNANVEFVEVDVTKDAECSNSICHKEIEDIGSQIRNLENKISKAQEAYHQELVMNLKKDVHIQKLEKKMEELRFNSFRNYLSDAAISELRTIDDLERKDSAFILAALKDLYRDNLTKLKEKTYSGRRKEPITPTKVNILRNLFTERLANDSSNKDRINNLPKCIKTSIEIINKKQRK